MEVVILEKDKGPKNQLHEELWPFHFEIRSKVRREFQMIDDDDVQLGVEEDYIHLIKLRIEGVVSQTSSLLFIF